MAHMLAEKIPLSYELSEKGELIIRNISTHSIIVWSIEIWFTAHVTSPISETTYYKKRMRDVILIRRELKPQETFFVDLGVSKKNILEIKIHYSIFGRFEIFQIIP